MINWEQVQRHGRWLPVFQVNLSRAARYRVGCVSPKIYVLKP